MILKQGTLQQVAHWTAHAGIGAGSGRCFFPMLNSGISLTNITKPKVFVPRPYHRFHLQSKVGYKSTKGWTAL